VTANVDRVLQYHYINGHNRTSETFQSQNLTEAIVVFF